MEQLFIKNIKGWAIIGWSEVKTFIQSLPDWYYEIGFKTIDNDTDALRKYYWGVVLDTICKETNWHVSRAEKTILHSHLRTQLLDWKSTKGMNKDERMDFIDNIKDIVSPIIIPASDLFNKENDV